MEEIFSKSLRVSPSRRSFDFEVIHLTMKGSSFVILSFKFESRAGDVIRSVETYSLLVLSFKFESRAAYV